MERVFKWQEIKEKKKNTDFLGLQLIDICSWNHSSKGKDSFSSDWCLNEKISSHEEISVLLRTTLQ